MPKPRWTVKLGIIYIAVTVIAGFIIRQLMVGQGLTTWDNLARATAVGIGAAIGMGFIWAYLSLRDNGVAGRQEASRGLPPDKGEDS
mgnify:CR=1 FL=1